MRRPLTSTSVWFGPSPRRSTCCAPGEKSAPLADCWLCVSPPFCVIARSTSGTVVRPCGLDLLRGDHADRRRAFDLRARNARAGDLHAFEFDRRRAAVRYGRRRRPVAGGGVRGRCRLRVMTITMAPDASRLARRSRCRAAGDRAHRRPSSSPCTPARVRRPLSWSAGIDELRTRLSRGASSAATRSPAGTSIVSVRSAPAPRAPRCTPIPVSAFALPCASPSP